MKRWCAEVFLNFVVPESSRLLTRLCRHELAAPPALSAETRLCTQEPAVGVLLDEAPLAMRQIFCERCLHITLGASCSPGGRNSQRTRNGKPSCEKIIIPHTHPWPEVHPGILRERCRGGPVSRTDRRAARRRPRAGR